MSQKGVLVREEPSEKTRISTKTKPLRPETKLSVKPSRTLAEEGHNTVSSSHFLNIRPYTQKVYFLFSLMIYLANSIQHIAIFFFVKTPLISFHSFGFQSRIGQRILVDCPT